MSLRRVRTPTVLQMDAAECGPAALAIVLGYFRKFVPLEAVRVACGVTRDGSKVSSIVKAARHFGLDANDMAADADGVLAGAMPAIVFWEARHFLVVEGMHGGRVYLNDPAAGRRSVTRAAFAQSFSGIVLRVAPGADFRREGRPPRMLPKLVSRLAGYGPAMTTVLAISLLLVVPGVIVPGFTRVFIDDILVKNLHNWLRPLMVALFVTVLVSASLSWVQLEVLRRIEMKLALVQSAAFIWHVLRLPAVFFTQRYLGDIASRVDSNDRVAKLLAGELGKAMLKGISAAFFALMMFAYDPFLAGIVVVGAGVNAGALGWIRQRREDAGTRLQNQQAAVFASTVIGLKTIETLKATGGENDFFAKWSGLHARSINTERSVELMDQVMELLPPLTSELVTAGVLGVGALRAISGDITIGTLVAFMTLLSHFIEPLKALVQVTSKAQQASADLARLDDVLEYPLDPRHRQRELPLEPRRLVAGHLTLREVTFGFEPLEPPFIDRFSLDVPPGGWVALVGGSGSGKSTISNLITGIAQPWSGAILIDGRPSTEWHPADLAVCLASVDQDLRLFEGTLRDNVCLWDDTIPHHRVVEAVTDAGLRDVVEALPANYDSLIEEGGRNLSGGQRQRIEIARALVRNPAVLVLDEATSALDPVTEGQVAAAIRRRGCTCIIVAHRLSTIRDCDEIIVLERGRIIERGSHDELLSRNGAYAHLVREELTT